MYTEKIREKIRQLQKKSMLLTNCYSEETIAKADKVWDSEDAILFAYNDNGIKRLIYYALRQETLAGLLRQIDRGEYALEFLTRKPEENRIILEEAGFQILAKMKRMSNPHCEGIFEGSPILTYFDEKIVGKATISDMQDIKRTLWSVFDTRVSHLPDDDGLLELIQKNEISIYRDEAGEIITILQTVTQPRRFYINQVYNNAHKGIVHAMLLNRLQKYVTNGGRYMYAWVEENNVASLKFHQKFGMWHDGMWNMVYMKQ